MRQVQALVQRPDVRKILANTGWLLLIDHRFIRHATPFFFG